jgi:glyoxylase-like metal-dependent hydrolase (beta-lactamase superfamily II)
VTEPRTVADAAAEVVPGVWHWSVHDERIDFRSDAYAVAAPGGAVLVDPLPLAAEALEALGPIAAVCVTVGAHQRSAWRYRRALGVSVYAPEGARGLEEEPDRRYGHDARLPGGLRAVHAPGPASAHYALLHERPGGAGVLFIADLMLRVGEGPPRFLPDGHVEDRALARATARALIGLSIAVLCPAHGAPLAGGAREAIRAALERDGAGLPEVEGRA